MNLQTETRAGVMYYGEFSTLKQDMDTRTWGVQVLIVREGMMFVQNDRDATDRIEAHVNNDGSVVFPDPELRLNGVSGGKKQGESIVNAVKREMKKEIGIEGEGEMRIKSEMPLMACYQEKYCQGGVKGKIMMGILVVYEPTAEEWSELQGKGEFVDIDEMLARAQQDAELNMRPAFRTALQMAKQVDREGINEDIIEAWVGAYNISIAMAVAESRVPNGVTLVAGLFGSNYGQ